MPPKRKLAADDEQVAAQCKDLQIFLEDTTPAALHAHVLRVAMSTKSTPEQLDAVSTIIAGLGFKSSKLPTDKHRIRCHEVYTEAGNGPKSCRLTHNYYSDPLWVGGFSPYVYTWMCCGHDDERPEGLGGPTTEWCFEGQHTEDRDLVADWEDERWYGFKMEEYITCADKKCDVSDEGRKVKKAKTALKKKKQTKARLAITFRMEWRSAPQDQPDRQGAEL